MVDTKDFVSSLRKLADAVEGEEISGWQMDGFADFIGSGSGKDNGIRAFLITYGAERATRERIEEVHRSFTQPFPGFVYGQSIFEAAKNGGSS
jgi:hypothetical protein